MSKEWGKHSIAFKAKVAPEALEGETVDTSRLHPGHVQPWKKAVLSGAASVFNRTRDKRQKSDDAVVQLYQQTVQLNMERDFSVERSELSRP